MLRSLLAQAARSGVEPTDELVIAATHALVETVSGELAQHFADAVVHSIPRSLDARKSIRTGFEQRLGELWGEAFDLLEAMIVCSVDFGVEFDRAERPAAAAEHDLVFEAVMRLHARACRIGLEILTLMRSGYAMGAMGRVRALEENVIVALFVREHGSETAERFLLHDRATRWRAANEQNAHAEALHMTPFSDVELDRLRATRDSVISHFDEPCFDADYGWALAAMGRGCSGAAHALPRARRHRVSFAEIEENVSLERYRPYVRMASRAIHADSGSLYWDIGLSQDSPSLLFYGPTNDGFSYPAFLTAHLIGLMTIGFVLVRGTTADRLMKASGIGKLADSLNVALRVAEQDLDERKKLHPNPGGFFALPFSRRKAKVRRRRAPVSPE
jgi:Family of unknown function (DUF5677)